MSVFHDIKVFKDRPEQGSRLLIFGDKSGHFLIWRRRARRQQGWNSPPKSWF